MIMKKTLSFTIALLVCAAAWGQKYKDCYAFDLKGDVRICVTTHPDGHRDTLRFTEEGALADGRKEVVRTEDGLPKTIITKQGDDGMAENPLRTTRAIGPSAKSSTDVTKVKHTSTVKSLIGRKT